MSLSLKASLSTSKETLQDEAIGNRAGRFHCQLSVDSLNVLLSKSLEGRLHVVVWVLTAQNSFLFNLRVAVMLESSH